MRLQGGQLRRGGRVHSVTHPDAKDSFIVGHSVAVVTWGGERIHDSERREAYYRHIGEVLLRYADAEREQRERRRNPGPARTPSGLSRRVTEALQVDHSRAETRQMRVGEMARLVADSESEHRDTPLVPDPRRDPT
jgi:hypothetical protein